MGELAELSWSEKSLSYKVLSIFAPVLVLTGIAGFLTPPSLSIMSGAPGYNIFHLIFGIVGIAFVASKNENLIGGFNVFFGLLDLYQAVASLMHWFPEGYFHWMRGDDVLHVVIGVVLVFAGIKRGSKW